MEGRSSGLLFQSSPEDTTFVLGPASGEQVSDGSGEARLLARGQLPGSDEGATGGLVPLARPAAVPTDRC